MSSAYQDELTEPYNTRAVNGNPFAYETVIVKNQRQANESQMSKKSSLMQAGMNMMRKAELNESQGPIAYEVTNRFEDKLYGPNTEGNEEVNPKEYLEAKKAARDAALKPDMQAERRLFLELAVDPTLKPILQGIQQEQLKEDDLKLLYRWTRPLIGSSDPEAVRARQILDLDGIQIQGLLRNVHGYPTNHLIAIVETYFKMSRQMEQSAFLTLLTNSIYSKSKSEELKETLEYLGQNWLTLKEHIK